MLITIVIPAYNEKIMLPYLLNYIKCDSDAGETEIIVVDGGSTDGTLTLAEDFGEVKFIQSSSKGRAIQMSEGADAAKEQILYFLHADSIPPKKFVKDITQAVTKGFDCGSYRLRFDRRHWFLDFITWFTRFNIPAFRWGDQSFFITRELYNRIGGFNTSLTIFEDQDIAVRAAKTGQMTVLCGNITTSADKYWANGPVKLQMVYFLLYIMYRLGYSHSTLLKVYRQWVKQKKI